MEYIGKKVTHKTLGDGNIIDQDATKITVQFKEKTSKFVYPDCFKTFLVLEDSVLQENALTDMADKEAEQEHIKKEQADYERVQRAVIHRAVGPSSSKRSGGGNGAGVYVLNFNAPSSLGELRDGFYDWNEGTNLDALLNNAKEGNTVYWTVPEYAHEGDTVLFYCAKTSIDSNHLGFAIRQARENGYDDIAEYGEREREAYKKYAGKILCTGEIVGDPDRSESDWVSTKMMVAEIGELHILKEPIAVNEIEDILKINRYGSTTSVQKDQWVRLKKLISEIDPFVKL